MRSLLALYLALFSSDSFSSSHPLFYLSIIVFTRLFTVITKNKNSFSSSLYIAHDLLRASLSHASLLRWLSTHYRLKSYFPDEAREVVKSFNVGMRDFFDSGRCGDVNYVDTYNMTERLGVDHPDEVL